MLLLFFLIFCEFFSFAFNLAVQPHWATAYLFVPQMVTLAGYIVLSEQRVLTKILTKNKGGACSAILSV